MNSKKLKKILIDKDLKQSKVAELMGVSVGYLNQTICGKKNPTLSFIKHLAKAINLTGEEVISIFFEELK